MNKPSPHPPTAQKTAKISWLPSTAGGAGVCTVVIAQRVVYKLYGLSSWNHERLYKISP